MIGTNENGATLPDLLTGNVTVTGVLYGQEEAYNPWMQTLTGSTGGKVMVYSILGMLDLELYIYYLSFF